MADSPSTTIVKPLVFELTAADGSLFPVPAELVYDTNEPLAVWVTFWSNSGESVVWVFSRELLAGGLTGPVGQGDIGIWPSRKESGYSVCLALNSPDGSALLECERDDLVSFVARMYEVLPESEESDRLDIDTMLDEIFAHADD
jgi:Streptomyces sporulation and cell division protein, SsgA